MIRRVPRGRGIDFRIPTMNYYTFLYRNRVASVAVPSVATMVVRIVAHLFVRSVVAHFVMRTFPHRDPFLNLYPVVRYRLFVAYDYILRIIF